jgi:hypothetical protein
MQHYLFLQWHRPFPGQLLGSEVHQFQRILSDLPELFLVCTHFSFIYQLQFQPTNYTKRLEQTMKNKRFFHRPGRPAKNDLGRKWSDAK